jgi:urease accessory protein
MIEFRTKEPMMRRTLSTTLVLTSALLPCLALAHTGTDGGAHHGFGAGFAHPFTGLDHLLAMLMVGAWSSVALRRWWVGPVAFATMVLVGALTSAAGLTLPSLEPMIALSLLLLGLFLAWRRPLPSWAAALVCGVFALFHGAAHGQELQGAAALFGMLLATLVLHLAGLMLGQALRDKNHLWTRAAGLGAGAVGLAMLAKVV